MDLPSPDPLFEISAQLRANQLGNAARIVRATLHEVKNDLGPLVGYLSILEEGLPADPAMFAAMQDSLARVQQRLERLLEPIQPRSPAVLERFCLHDFVRHSMGVWTNAGLFRRTKIALDQEREPPNLGPAWVLGYRDELGQILMNLVCNGIDAVDGRTTDSPQSIAPSVRVVTRVEGPRVILEVHDAGPGLQEELKERIFEPFFSTKPGTGSGLGLSTAQLVVQRLQGQIDIQAGPQGGTRAIVSLPNVGPARAL